MIYTVSYQEEERVLFRMEIKEWEYQKLKEKLKEVGMVIRMEKECKVFESADEVLRWIDIKYITYPR